MKPVPLFEYQIRNSSLPEAAVLDLFSGSGTTGVACERSGRTAYLMEYDPRYAEAAAKALPKQRPVTLTQHALSALREWCYAEGDATP